MQDTVFAQDARRKLLAGINKVGNAVRITMGPKGRAVLIPKSNPTFTLDGVTVAKAIGELKDPVEDMGAQIVKNVASKTNEQAGDGTTTATVLTQTLTVEGFKGIEQGVDPIEMRRGIEDGARAVLERIKKEAKPVKTRAQMEAIATISSREPEVGKILAELYDSLGADGVITTEEVKTVGLEVERVEGMQVDNGYISPYFMTNGERAMATIENPLILVTSQVLSRNEDVVPAMEQAMQSDGKTLVIIADDVNGEALATLIVNKLQKRMLTLVVKAPGFGDNKRAHLEDICAVTGATYISEETGVQAEQIEREMFGKATRVVAYKNRTLIVGGKGKQTDIKKRVAALRAELKESDISNYRTEILRKRIAKLSGGVAIIRVGDVTEEAASERMYRIEDAINATRSAMEEGVVQGGGLALYRAANVVIGEMLAKLNKGKELQPAYRYGLEVLRTALQRPAHQILENEGKRAEVLLSDPNYTVPENVIDPHKVERVALELAVSTAGLFLINEAVVYNTVEEKKSL